jgi:uncharacterized protein (DUF2237 family)
MCFPSVIAQLGIVRRACGANVTDEAEMAIEIDESVNVLGERLEPCSTSPMTGFFRNGCCDTADVDQGSHTVCAVMTAEFLDFSKSRGNDLSTPRPEFGFAGLKPGDRWCLCAARWLEADQAGKAPRVRLASTHRRALEICPLDRLRAHAMDLS